MRAGRSPRLGGDADPPVDGAYPQRAGAGDRVELLGDLTGELACGREHQRGGGRRRGRGALHHRDPEGERLAGAGRRLDEDIAPLDDVAQDEALDGEGGGDTAALERAHDVLGHAQVGE